MVLAYNLSSNCSSSGGVVEWIERTLRRALWESIQLISRVISEDALRYSYVHNYILPRALDALAPLAPTKTLRHGSLQG